MMTETRFLN